MAKQEVNYLRLERIIQTTSRSQRKKRNNKQRQLAFVIYDTPDIASSVPQATLDLLAQVRAT